jgi:hypothetical protein
MNVFKSLLFFINNNIEIRVFYQDNHLVFAAKYQDEYFVTKGLDGITLVSNTMRLIQQRLPEMV